MHPDTKHSRKGCRARGDVSAHQQRQTEPTQAVPDMVSEACNCADDRVVKKALWRDFVCLLIRHICTQHSMPAHGMICLRLNL